MGWGTSPGPCLPNDVTVLGVEVPCAADGLFALHQDARALAHLAVEKLQAQLLARGSVLAELVERYQEVAVGAHLQRHAVFVVRSATGSVARDTHLARRR
jgi:hypothetical protein